MTFEYYIIIILVWNLIGSICLNLVWVGRDITDRRKKKLSDIDHDGYVRRMILSVFAGPLMLGYLFKMLIDMDLKGEK